MRAENEKLDIEREAAQRLLSEMEDAGAQKAAELAALSQENENLSQERTEMQRLVSTAQQQAEATGLELSRTVEENSKLRESADSMQVELHRLKTEKLAQQVRGDTNAMLHARLRAKIESSLIVLPAAPFC
jgi:chromosome segregation ATPase